jgi:hypothetical protein
VLKFGSCKMGRSFDWKRRHDLDINARALLGNSDGCGTLRYVRYISASGGHGNVAEVKVIEEQER